MKENCRLAIKLQRYARNLVLYDSFTAVKRESSFAWIGIGNGNGTGRGAFFRGKSEAKMPLSASAHSSRPRRLHSSRGFELCTAISPTPTPTP